MARSRNFSIYLLKNGFNAANALKVDHKLKGPFIKADNLPDGAEFYIDDKTGSDPWWKSFWGIDHNLHQVLKGAIVFITIEEKCFALTFGHTYHNLRNDSYEYDFGLRTTLNAIDPNKIRSTDIFQPEDARRERIQSPVASDLNYFDINSDESIVKKLTGAVRSNLAPYFRNITGANNIRISSNVKAKELVDVCSKLFEIYKKEDYKDTFPDLQNIEPINDPEIIDELDLQLMLSFQEETIDLVLTIPEILDHDNGFYVTFGGVNGPRKKYDTVFIGHYREFLKDRGIENVEISDLKRHHIKVKNDNGSTIKEFSIYKCFLFDCSYNGDYYHLCDGAWYRIEKDFVVKLKNSLDPYFSDHPVLQECNEKLESRYNAYISEAYSNYVCLDGKNISIDGQAQIEPCDIFTVDGDVSYLIHVKISTRSASLSHLFNQGISSVQLLRGNDESREKLKNLLENKHNAVIDKGNFFVVYGIITKKNKEMKSEALPIFSRISLFRVIQFLKLMAIDCRVVLIEDLVDRR